jgi:arylsulfatase A-like enzyme
MDTGGRMNLHNREILLRFFVLTIINLVVFGCSKTADEEALTEHQKRPNVLFFSVDDLNDWIEPLGGHPQARTPNLNALAEESVLFTQNYCASPGCNPSRTALLTGIHTYHSGMYSNYQYWREVLPDAQTLPQFFMANGYWAGGAGKIFHNDQPDPESWDEYYPSKEKHMPDYFIPRPGETVNMPAFKNMYGAFDWTPIDITDEETGDFRSVQWVIDQLNREHDRPFFLACGIYRPHLPWYVPQKYFDMFPIETIQLPKYLEKDLEDVGVRARDIARRGGNYHKHVVEANQWKNAVQGYLASIAYADAMVGKVIDALENSTYAENTIIVLWSDHGWQLGEKTHWRKFALWENVVRTVLMVKAPIETPGLSEGSVDGGRCDRVTSLMDIFPTLVELCGLPQKENLDGHSLVPLLKDPDVEWDYPAVTTYDFSEFSIRTQDWRYIRYIDDSEELYDHRSDPEEWNNLANKPEYQEIKKNLRGYIPKNPAPLVDTSYKTMPHHILPLKSKGEYYNRKKMEEAQAKK